MKNLKRITFVIIFAILMLLIMSNKTHASTLNVTTSKATVSPGETFKVTVNVSGGAGIANISVKNGTGSSSQFIDNSSYSFDCKAGSSGNVSISVSATIADYSTEKDEQKSASKTVNIKTATSNQNNSSNQNTSTTKKSSDATLSTLGVSPKEYDFNDFSKNKTSYSITVPNSVEKLTVQYKTSNSKASVKVSGNTNLVVGSSNKISVVVTAEDGTKKTYTIKVTKLAKDEEKEGNLIDEENDDKKDEENKLQLEKLVVKNYVLSPEFSSDVYSYKIDVNMEENDIDKLELEYSANSSDAKIEVVGNENLKEGENIITIMISDEKTEEKTVYQIIVNKTKPEEQTQEVLSTIEKDDNNIINKGKNILITIFVVLIVLIIIIIILIQVVEKRLNQEPKAEKEDTKEDKEPESKTYYENKENDTEILNKINKNNKGKHF